MTDHRNISTDEGLKDNEQMEQAILSLQQNPTQEMLAHALTVVRRRMQAHGQLIVAVEPRWEISRCACRLFRPMMEKNGGLLLPVSMRN